MLAVPLRWYLLGDFFIEHSSEHAFGVVMGDDSIVGNRIAHCREHPLHEEALHLERRLPESSIGTLLGRCGWTRGGCDERSHRMTISAAIAPIERNDSKIAAISTG